MKAVYPNLHSKMMEKHVSKADIAALCGITKFTCFLKFYGILPWKFTEVVAICRLFGETNAELLFVRLDIIS